MMSNEQKGQLYDTYTLQAQQLEADIKKIKASYAEIIPNEQQAIIEGKRRQIKVLEDKVKDLFK